MYYILTSSYQCMYFFMPNMFLDSECKEECIGFIIMCFLYKCIAEEIRIVGEGVFYLTRGIKYINTSLSQSLLYRNSMKYIDQR